MQRRGFLAGILVAAAAPAVVRSGILMPVRAPIVVPEFGISMADMLRIKQSILNEASCTLVMGEIGHIDSFRFILSPMKTEAPRIIKFRRWEPAMLRR